MTTRIGAAIAAGFLAIGILVGAAGAIVIRGATTSDHMADIGSMMPMMGAGQMSQMMGSGSPIGPQQHEWHHPTPSPEATR